MNIKRLTGKKLSIHVHTKKHLVYGDSVDFPLTSELIRLLEDGWEVVDVEVEDPFGILVGEMYDWEEEYNKFYVDIL